MACTVVLWLLWMTLRPNQQVAAGLAPLTSSAASRGVSGFLLIDLAGNVAVFVPLGLALSLALAGRPWRQRAWGALLAGAAVSLGIELLQLAVPSRVTALGDWLLNTVGVSLGVLGGWVVKRSA